MRPIGQAFGRCRETRAQREFSRRWAGSGDPRPARPLAAGEALFGVRRLDAAFIALESGNKLPHSTAGGIGDLRRALLLPHLRNIKKRKCGRQTIASFTLRIKMGCLTSDRSRYSVEIENWRGLLSGIA